MSKSEIALAIVLVIIFFVVFVLVSGKSESERTMKCEERGWVVNDVSRARTQVPPCIDKDGNAKWY